MLNFENIKSFFTPSRKSYKKGADKDFAVANFFHEQRRLWVTPAFLLSDSAC